MPSLESGWSVQILGWHNIQLRGECLPPGHGGGCGRVCGSIWCYPPPAITTCLGPAPPCLQIPGPNPQYLQSSHPRRALQQWAGCQPPTLAWVPSSLKWQAGISYSSLPHCEQAATTKGSQEPMNSFQEWTRMSCLQVPAHAGDRACYQGHASSSTGHSTHLQAESVCFQLTKLVRSCSHDPLQWVLLRRDHPFVLTNPAYILDACAWVQIISLSY